MRFVNCDSTAHLLYFSVAATDVSATSSATGSDSSTIALSFYAANAAKDECPSYVWATGDWGLCSATCGAGLQRRAVTCTTEYGDVVPAAMCGSAVKPDATQPCDKGRCQWQAGPWSDCSAMCGGGMSVRGMTCRNGNGAGDAVFEVNCGQKPQTTARCNPEPCPSYYWSTSNWNSCSKPCGGGVMLRSVSCVDNSAGAHGTSAATVASDDSLCPGQRPPTQQSCNTQVAFRDDSDSCAARAVMASRVW